MGVCESYTVQMISSYLIIEAAIGMEFSGFFLYVLNIISIFLFYYFLLQKIYGNIR